MKVLLVSPPSDSPIKSTLGAGGIPLGLAYLASVLKEEHEVKILDAFTLNFNQEKLKKKIKQLLLEAYFYFYLRPSFILKRIKEKNLFLVKAALRGVFNHLRW